MENLEGKKIGFLKIQKNIGGNSAGTPMYKCKCVCGKTLYLSQAALKHQRSCGCKKDYRANSETLCWKCANAVPEKNEYGEYIRGCEWSISGKPVPNWNAVPTEKCYMQSYRVVSCSKFAKWERKRTELALGGV